MTYFVQVENLFSTLLTTAGHVLSSSERVEVERFIEVGEYGLALETLADIFFEERKIASAEIEGLVSQIAKLMSLDPEPMLQKLRRP